MGVGEGAAVGGGGSKTLGEITGFGVFLWFPFLPGTRSDAMR